MNKIKVHCSVCGKSFKTPSAKKTVCPSCEAAAKRAKHQPAAAPAMAAAAASAATVDVRAVVRAAQENQGQFGAYKPPAPPPEPVSHDTKHSTGTHGHPHGNGHAGRGTEVAGRPSPKPRAPRPVREPRPAREPKPRVTTKPFEPTSEQIDAIRERYLQLAQPEYDGIRHQIANELGIPLRTVKFVIKETRAETKIQSWWERGGGLPSPESLEKIREIYVQLLPNAEVGVHKQIASQLHLTNTCVYQAIAKIRGDMQLPRYVPHEAGEAEGEHIEASGEAVSHSMLQAASGE